MAEMRGANETAHEAYRGTVNATSMFATKQMGYAI
jgi:hypothetical protein